MATKTNKPAANVVLNRETQNGILGLSILAFIPFEEGGFTAEKAGNKYFIPLKARGEDGKLLKDDAGNQLYMVDDGSMTIAPFGVDGRTVANRDKGGEKLNPAEPAPQIEWKQATPHLDFQKRVTDENVLFSDGLMRDVVVSVKANNPRTVAEYKESRQAATATRNAGKVQSFASAATLEQIDEAEKLFAQRKAELQAKPAKK